MINLIFMTHNGEFLRTFEEIEDRNKQKDSIASYDKIFISFWRPVKYFYKGPVAKLSIASASHALSVRKARGSNPLWSILS